MVSACTTTKNAITVDDGNSNEPALSAYSKPLKVFGIGYWSKNYMIVTLTDAKNQYFTMKVLADTTLKIGNIYNLSPE